MEGTEGGQHRPEDDEPRVPEHAGDSPVPPTPEETSGETDPTADHSRAEGEDEDPDIVVRAQQLQLGRFAVRPDEARTTEEDETEEADPLADPVDGEALQDLIGLISAEREDGIAPADPLRATYDELQRRIADREKRRRERKVLPEPREPDASEKGANEGGSPVSAMGDMDEIQLTAQYAQYDAEGGTQDTETVKDNTQDADKKSKLPSPRPPSDPEKPDGPNGIDQ